MITALIKVKDYTMPCDHIHTLAEECYGKLLSGVGDGDHGAFEFGFDGDPELAAIEKVPTAVHAKQCASLFLSLLNSPSWRRAGAGGD